MTSKTTVAILAAAAGVPYTIPFSGPVSWLFGGEAASAFLGAVATERTGTPVFDLDGVCVPVEDGVALLKRLAPSARIDVSGAPLAFPMDKPDDPLENHVGP